MNAIIFQAWETPRNRVLKKLPELAALKAPFAQSPSHGEAVTGGLCGTMCEFARTPAKREHSAASIPPSRLRLPTSLYTSEALARCLFINFYGEPYFLDSLKRGKLHAD